ncbi:hypothetical protein LIER_23471 [Lithospermum erythrorhizon]|uniref:Reverse transcriptase domain-containing protein n=1 Tax=Lithospermum erythrorhizon TaxID=34254 RepID=A0AAV3QXJ0_LITER
MLELSGFGPTRAVRSLAGLVTTKKPLLILLIETKLWTNEWEVVKKKLRMPNGFFVDARGRNGGLALLLPRDVQVDIKSFSTHHVEACIMDDPYNPWRFVGFYGHHEVGKRKHSWNLMRLLSGLSDLPTLFMGNFNEILNNNECVSQRRLRRNWQMEQFRKGTITASSKGEATVLALDIDKLRAVDEVYWCQRSKVFWRVKGDRNTTYFHAVSAQRSKTNLITALQNDEGTWHRSKKVIHEVATTFYTKLSTTQSEGNMFQPAQLLSSQFDSEVIHHLDGEFTKEDVKKCLFTMSGSKSPRPDGMSAKFFQHFWDIVGDSLCNMVLCFLNDARFLKKLNFTLITLIPKVERPIQMSQFRPMALCNTVVKVIGKALAMRLQKFLPQLISESQSAFVPNRLITENILLAYEAHHLIKHRKRGNQGLMSIKLDMLKAYDRIGWNFLRAMIFQLGFSDKWVNQIMLYVESVTYSLLVNGDQVAYIKPRRGLRQGDPLSPYLFIMCTEGLISLLNGACNKGELNGILLGPSLNPLSHLMFADDTLFLGQALVEQIRNEITGILGMPQTTSHGKYLELSTRIGSSKKEVFISIIDRVKSRVDNWKSRLLSKAARLGSAPSFTWRSLLSMRDLLYNGIKWVLGDGKSISVWHHNWNIDKVRTLFYQVDCDAFIQIPLNKLGGKDIPIWKNHVKGIFTVKGAYKVIEVMEMTNDFSASSNIVQTFQYSQIWKIDVPRKVNHFIYRAIHNRLATTDNLSQRGVTVQRLCRFCQKENEDLMHVLLYCKYAKEVYQILNIRHYISRSIDFKELFNKYWNCLPRDVFTKWVICI